MTYSAEELERQFQQVASIRRGKKEFTKDDGYWDGGRCNWGGSHNLKEDCETLAKAFNKMESFGKIREELQTCTSKSEYDVKKANYIRKCDEIIDGLAIKNEGVNFIFGICCIWGKKNKDNEKNIESKAKVAQQNLQQLKKSLEREDYKWVQEIKELNLEINKINQKIEENKTKAVKETDPIKKAVLIQAIEDDGKLLQEKYTKRKKLGSKLIFNPDKHVSNLINSIKKSIERSGNRTDNKNKGLRTPNALDTDDEDNNTDDESVPSNENTPQNFYQNNQSLIIFGVIIALLIFYLYYSHEEEPNYYDF